MESEERKDGPATDEDDGSGDGCEEMVGPVAVAVIGAYAVVAVDKVFAVD